MERFAKILMSIFHFECYLQRITANILFKPNHSIDRTYQSLDTDFVSFFRKFKVGKKFLGLPFIFLFFPSFLSSFCIFSGSFRVSKMFLRLVKILSSILVLFHFCLFNTWNSVEEGQSVNMYFVTFRFCLRKKIPFSFSKFYSI